MVACKQRFVSCDILSNREDIHCHWNGHFFGFVVGLRELTHEPLDKQIWNCCRSPAAFICHKSRTAGFLITRQFHRTGFDDLLHRNSAAVYAAGDPFIPIPNGSLPVRCWLYRSARHDSRSRAALGACPRVGGLDYIAFCFVKEHVVRASKTGLPTNLTLVSDYELRRL